MNYVIDSLILELPNELKGKDRSDRVSEKKNLLFVDSLLLDVSRFKKSLAKLLNHFCIGGFRGSWIPPVNSVQLYTSIVRRNLKSFEVSGPTEGAIIATYVRKAKQTMSALRIRNDRNDGH